MGQVPVLAGQRITAAMLNGLPVTLTQLATGSLTNVAAAEAVIGTFTIPANDPGASVGSGYQFHVVGTGTSTTAVPTLSIRVRIGGLAGTQFSNVWGGIVIRVGAGQAWVIDGTMYFTAGGAAAQAAGHMTLDQTITSGTPALLGGPSFGTNPGTFDSTAAWTLVVTAQYSATTAAVTMSTTAGAMYRI